MRPTTKRVIIEFLIILVCFLLQSTIFHLLRFAYICPNLLIIVTTSFSFMKGDKTGMKIGMVCGLFVDLFWGNMIGLYMLIFMVIGYIDGQFQRLFYDEDIKLPILLVSLSELIYGLATYFCLYMLEGDFAFFAYLGKVILPELVYTVLITFLLYQIILRINKWLENEEQRSESKFV